ncbi:MAG: hypothetical protein EOO98_00040 [Pedobacter sp.]|nr:MAG: hypothetical protein EOO98_00040 [Pedobacter sp.]
MKRGYIILAFMLAGYTAQAQQGFGTSNPAPSSVIDMVATNKGVLFPRVALTSTTTAMPVTAPANALTVFNTAITGDVTPGFYYWSQDTVTPANSKWVKLANSNDLTEPWQVEGTVIKATTNTQNIYQNGNLGIGDFTGNNPTERLDIGSGNVRIREINLNPGIGTDRLLVADANGILKTVDPSLSNKINYSFVEQETGRKWIDGKTVYEITGQFVAGTDFTGVNIYSLIPNFNVPNALLLEVRLVQLNELETRNTTEIQSFDATTGEMIFGTQGSLAVSQLAGQYYIILEYIKEQGIGTGGTEN